MKKTLLFIGLCALLVLTGCASKKNLESTPKTPTTDVTNKANAQLAFVQKVSDNSVYAQNIVSSLTFTATMGGKEISVPGQLHMRRNQVIRLQLMIPILGTEVGRLEFTPDYVLVIDRLHKEYIKGDYNQLDFLKDNGLNFYSLQALFWNQLLMPGKTKVGEGDLSKFSADINATGVNVPVTLTDGLLKFVWAAERGTGRINKTDITYTSKAHGKSALTWLYSNFKALGTKKFPATQEFTFHTTATGKQQSATVKLEMSSLKTDSDWETTTTVSSRYKQVDVHDVFGKIMNM